jgi:hypothetical protein
MKLRAEALLNGQDTEPPPAALLDIMQAAYQGAITATPFLPYPGSVLPALVALQKTQSTIEESRAYLKSQQLSIERTQRQLETEKANLNDQRALAAALENRIMSVRGKLETQSEQTSEQVARGRIDALVKQKRDYERETSKLLKSLTRFIDDHLGPMLAAEDLGGPVVGDMMDVDEDQLVAGFNAQGRPKKAHANPNEDRRQRRLDEIWGGAEEGAPTVRGKTVEAAAASAEMRELTEELLNAVMNAGGDSSVAYVHLERESAAARFLVRSQVAQFHPKDSKRLRLVDFGREIDD